MKLGAWLKVGILIKVNSDLGKQGRQYVPLSSLYYLDVYGGIILWPQSLLLTPSSTKEPPRSRPLNCSFSPWSPNADRVQSLSDSLCSLYQKKSFLTRSRCENCFAKSSKAIQNSPSFRTRTESSSLSLSDKESHSQLLSLQGPFHSPLPQGFRNLTRWVSPEN